MKDSLEELNSTTELKEERIKSLNLKEIQRDCVVWSIKRKRMKKKNEEAYRSMGNQNVPEGEGKVGGEVEIIFKEWWKVSQIWLKTLFYIPKKHYRFQVGWL